MTLLSGLVALVTVLTSGSAQNVGATSGFAMTAPEAWHRATSEGLEENLGQIKMSPEALRKLLASSVTSTLVVAYTKYQPAAHAGLIPTIRVLLRNNPAKTFESFFKMISRSMEEPTAYLPDFAITEPARKTSVGGRPAVFFGATFSLETQTAGRLQVRARTYAVMNGDAFFQINFVDGPTDDCSAVFDRLVETIRFD